ncbi:hypothetical protein NAEGRDRAFT_31511 [Naegleria gruberi]|uniref:Uncharacterized protein FM174 n=1 Tax=Naegleria gruberi TaxID=5762 RepID=D2V6G3_NAEGR|nr:uncharacterized protein NAEGRDRAFT_31511 [Naegleria gruberi]EFC47567.1 hypothetical protein NAEGRDRAFT_31511 [Naegleria gruberi]|eukprot:XP_002680311.1 hypothetical protein NAEGRDRAFT_31511 [Naegleria gruberi strain NEG-M]
MSTTNKRLLLVSYPEGLIKEDNFKLEEIALPNVDQLGEEQLVVRLLHLSVDPYMRIRMSAQPPKGYFGPYPLNEPVSGGAVAKVVKVGAKLAETYKEGDIVYGALPWVLEQVVDLSDKSVYLRKLEGVSGIPLSYFLGVLGMPGLTSYFGLIDICAPKEGETIVVSAASGAVGSVVGQIGKILGCRVVGISGNDNVKELLENGFDAVINYKKFNNNVNELKKAIDEECPKGVDCYFDNTGGFILDAVTLAMNCKGRISFCGAISSYNEQNPETGLRLSTIHVVRELKTQGFIISSFMPRFQEGTAQLVQWLLQGKLKAFETKFTGLENIPKALQSLFTGEKSGKVVVDL